MADIIKLLPDHVANQIAAGEVVQRPASVVKELLENAIDAGATTIKLIVKDGGKTLIQVVDNGVGMSETDARLCFERHATSKITTAEDLFNLRTKGFRGEALASIAAIAHVDMQSRTTDEDTGTHIKIEGSKVVFQELVATPKGTSLAVKNLFFNIPARRNFLKSNQLELKHITDEFQRVALVHPNVAFQFYNNGSELFNLPVENPRQRIVHVFGSKMNERLVPVNEATDVVKISGFICKPEFAKKSRGAQFFFANGRYIRSPYLHHAVSAAFEGLVQQGTHPGYFLYLEVDPSTIDINIHPTKTEVKFDDEHTLYAILRSAVKHSLGQFNVVPALDFERDGNLDTPYTYREKQAVFPQVTVDASFNPFDGIPQSKGGTKQGNYQKESVKGWESLYGDVLENDGDDTFSSLHVESELESPELFDTTNPPLAPVQRTFQLQHKYVVTTLKSGLLVIDQHRAHKRVLYERFLEAGGIREGVSQQLLFPLVLGFTLDELGLLKSLEEDLVALGFILDFDKEALTVGGIPNMMTESTVESVLKTLVLKFEEERAEDSRLTKAHFLAKTLSASLAIKNGQPLEPESQMALVNDLFGCKEPKMDPSNKIIYTTLAVNDIAKNFM